MDDLQPIPHDPGAVYGPVVNVGYFVASTTTAGVYYVVNGRSCSCTAGQHGADSCIHRRRVAAKVAEQNRRDRRPNAPANISALVD